MNETLYGGPMDGLVLAPNAPNHIIVTIIPQTLQRLLVWCVGSRDHSTHQARYVRQNGRLVYADMSPNRTTEGCQ